MSPEDRQRALANLPPARRAQVLKRLQSYQTLTPQERARANSQLRQLQSLPPKQQNQVRGSLQKFQKLNDERKAAVGSELDRLGTMPADQRAARMNSPEFKAQYSGSERQMIGDISKVLPPGK
jgi:phage-related protein